MIMAQKAKPLQIIMAMIPLQYSELSIGVYHYNTSNYDKAIESVFKGI